MAKVSINLITWNGERYIENCLRSVLNQTFKDFSIIIIDNGSADQTVEIINERFPQLRVIKHKENIGFVKAHNQAIHWSKSDYVLCLNQDTVLEPHFLQALVDFLDSHPLCGSATGKILRLQDDLETKYVDSLGIKIYKNYRVSDLGSGEVDSGQYDNSEEIFGVSGALPFYRRKALEETMYQQEYFDEDFFSYKEDADLAHRLRRAGWSAWRVAEAVAYHDRTVSCPSEKITKIQIAKNRKRKSKFANFYSYRNHIYFIAKNLPKFNLKFFWPVFWYEFVKFGYVVLFETGNLRAWKDIFRNWKKMMLKRRLIQKNSKVSDEEISKWLN